MTAADVDLEEWSPQGPVTELSTQHCWRLLTAHGFGRLGVSVDDQPEIFPVDYFADGASIVFRTANGTKKEELLANRRIVFEVDERTESGAWSVTVKGQADVVPDGEIPRAAKDALPWWTPTSEFVYVRITPSVLRGRRFERHLRPDLLEPDGTVVDSTDLRR